MSGDEESTSVLQDSFFASDQSLVGHQFGHYHVIGELGKGGMATVYKADELSLNRVVALKVMSAQISDDATMIKRFEREAQAAAQLNHPNIVHIYAIGEENGVHYFTMEYVRGLTLSQLRRKHGALSPADVIPYLIQTAEALGEAHRHGMVHRDIKPSNIMLDDAGRVKVTDFGIAHVASAKTQLTVAGSFLGTPQYMSPEQCEGKAIDGRSDIYSLGVTFYELITGKNPFDAETPGSMLIKIVQGQFRPLQDIDPGIPTAVRTVIEKMLKTSPKKRYQNAEEVVQALQNLQKVVGESTVATAFDGTMATVPPQPAPKKRNRWLLPAAAAAVLLVMLASAGLWLGPGRKRAAEAAGQAGDGDGRAAAAAVGTPRESVELTEASAVTDEEPVSGEEALPAPSAGGDEPPAETVPAPELPPAPAPEPVAEVTQEPATPGPAPAADPELARPLVAAAVPEPLEPAEPVAAEAAPAVVAVEEPVASETARLPVVPEPAVPVPAALEPTVDPVAVAEQPQPAEPALVAKAPDPLATAVPDAPVPSPVPSPVKAPPDDSLLITASGAGRQEALIVAKVQRFVRGLGYKIVSGRGSDAPVSARAELELSIEVSSMGSQTLKYLGRSSEMYTDALTLRLLRMQDGELVAGPFTEQARYTTLNADEKLEAAIRKLTTKLRAELER